MIITVNTFQYQGPLDKYMFASPTIKKYIEQSTLHVDCG